MGGRYRDAVRELVADPGFGLPGLTIVQVPTGDQAEVASAIAARSEVEVVGPLVVDALGDAPGLLVGAGLPAGPQAAGAVLRAINERRSWLKDRGCSLVLLVSRAEYQQVERRAPDAWSAAHARAQIPFVPAADVDEADALERYRRWLGERFGRLDLRGFIRSEAEDVSWPVEELYQDLKAEYVFLVSRRPEASGIGPYSLASVMDRWAYPSRLQQVLLGYPGTGKSFFLRWLALRGAAGEPLLGAERPLPVVASLAAYARASGRPPLMEHLEEVLLEARQPAAHLLRSLSQAGRVVFLLDGVDEAGDSHARRAVAGAVTELRKQAPSCPVVATSRVAGYDEAPLPADWIHHMLAPFGPKEIRGFLRRWCSLYSQELQGRSERARRAGDAEGRQLAADVLASDQVRGLAENPLLLTVLAIVHRAGVRLPDHRIELYHHATQVLVERWNRIRSPDATRHTPPIKAADAIRLLGPVALRGIEQGGGGAISEARLREIIGPVLATGHVKGVANPDEAIEIFRRSLGLLVEKAPGLYGFLHLTLGEYFAARELVRGPGLDELAADKKRAFEPQWREVLLLAIGELGVLQADDARVEALVDMLLAGTRRPHRPSPGVPSLLAGLLADDPNLGPAHAQRVVETLVPTWWFVRKYWEGSVLLAIHDATKLVGSRLRHGRFGALLAERVERTYGDGVPRKVQESFARLGANAAAAHAALEAFVRAATSEDPRGP